MDKRTEERLLSMIEMVAGDDIVYDERDIDLFEEGYFNSMGAIEFLVDLETEFGVVIAPTELEREEMNTVNKIVARVDERLPGAC